ncbi:hypothetical protein [Nocardioides pocheonensis]|uniref:Uncharacterized protein n=1 Tax=Nocardioides pocheonensis TaxID=661485 RepID=A0A3N0GWB7_9ACTN|nr:hypothetical protein [Nocardioides pocheonensis]RNM16486.1 hypothetical protein EFL26_04815 [Nocardioides pocheonensis]
MSDKVPNVYKYALVGARPAADARAAEIRSALNAASLALMAGAWKSTLADEFGRALGDHRSTLQSAAGEERDAIDAEVAVQPDEVAPDSWQANWARLARLEAMP